MEFKSSNTQIHRHPLIIVIALLFLFSCNQSIAQTYSSSDKKAIKIYLEAQAYYQKHDLSSTKKLLEKSIERDSNFVEAQTLLAYIHLDQGKYESAKTQFRKAISINHLLIPNNLYFLAELELKDGEYLLAEKHFNQFINTSPSDPSIINKTNNGLNICHYAIQSKNNPVPFLPTNLGAGVNSQYDEYFPCLTVDAKTILFTRRLPNPNTPQGFNEDFFISLKNTEWEEAKNIDKPINTLMNEGAPSLSADGQILFFTACELFGDYGPDRKGYGSCDIFYTFKNGKNWKQPFNLGQSINTGNWETQPSFSADGKTLYFIRGKKSRSGNRRGDIYKTTLETDGYWSKPIPLGPQINTVGNEESVFIHPDGKTLYFSSDGHLGMGGLDIFKSNLLDDGSWSKPINLGYPINTHNNENSLLVSANGNLAYFASNRENGFGGLDLYSFELPENLKPNEVSYFTGKIFDKESKEPLSARFELIDLESKKIIIESYSNKADGEFLIALPTGRAYALNASKDGYLFYSDNFSLEKTNNKPVKKDIPMQAIKVGESIVLNNIFFESGQFDLKTQSIVELNKLVGFLNLNSTIRIEISGHTDTDGVAAKNITLSKNRANSVSEYLIKEGIQSTRITSNGYGSNKPIANNDTESGKAKNRRTEFKITGM